MMFCDFQHKLKQLNPDLFIDANNSRSSIHPDYPCAGLYVNNKRNQNLEDTRNYRYIMGVPQQHVPEYSIYGLKTEQFNAYNSHKIYIGQKLDNETIEKARNIHPTSIEDKPIWKGYRAILAQLSSEGLIDPEKASRLFGIEVQPKRKRFPRDYLAI